MSEAGDGLAANAPRRRTLPLDIEDRFWPKVDKSGDCWEWTASLRPNGYGQIGGGPGNSPLKSHRVSYELANGPIPEGMFTCHTCDNPPCVNPTHLFAATQAENNRDMLRKGRAVHAVTNGESNARSRLTWEAVEEIRASAESGAALSARYGVSGTTISKVRRWKAWKQASGASIKAISPAATN